MNIKLKNEQRLKLENIFLKQQRIETENEKLQADFSSLEEKKQQILMPILKKVGKNPEEIDSVDLEIGDLTFKEVETDKEE